jgi:hypothetical protein
MILHRTTIENSHSYALTVVIEPWGEEHVLSPSDSLEVVLYGPSGGAAELRLEQRVATVFGWEGSELYVLKQMVPVVQPSLERLIRTVTGDAPWLTEPGLETENLEYTQVTLDSCPAWNAEGVAAAFTAVARMAAELHANGLDKKSIWEVAQLVLKSRGVFLQNLSKKQTAFCRAIVSAESSDNSLRHLLESWSKKLAEGKSDVAYAAR